ncbi:MAG: GMP synthase [Chitinophaga sp.]|jgi:homoserine O-succinyltransferase/O-acetyltransferase|nr:GMP synthase [Chitinophaga sp.]
MNNAEKTIRIAILDLYEGQANQGMRCIREIIAEWSKQNNLQVTYNEFDVRQKLELPDLSYDAYISSGGPGSPLDSEGTRWDNAYFQWLQTVEDYNNNVLNSNKKLVFFICHSFQLACRHYNIGNVCKRKSTSFGVFPVHQINTDLHEIIFDGLKDPFYAVDSREFQVIEPDNDIIEKLGATVLAIEKERPHINLPRAIMAVRFNDYFFGTQFHPEADATGMSMYLQRADKKQAVIDEHGEAKWQSMIEQLQDPDKIMYTYSHILPNFLNEVVGELV